MTRFRLVSTLIALGLGAGMAASYMTPDTPAAPERIKPHSILPSAPAASNTSLPASLPPAADLTSKDTEPQTSAPPMVALPSGPLLRSATEAPPIDTSSVQPAAPVRHETGSQALRPASLDVDDSGAEDSPAPVARPAPRLSPAGTRRSAHKSKKIESLFLNPLGTR